MSRIQNIYNVNQIKQLINLNNNKTNFDLTFEVKSLSNKPIKAVVVSEANLNSGNQIEYKDVIDGYISGNIINDKGVYQNYFLLLKSDEPNECEVIINIKDIPLNPEAQMQQQQQQQQQQQINRQQQQLQINRNQNKNRDSGNEMGEIDEKKNKILSDKSINHNSIKGDSTNWVLIIGICIIVGIGIWYMYTKSKKNKSQTYSHNPLLTNTYSQTPQINQSVVPQFEYSAMKPVIPTVIPPVTPITPITQIEHPIISQPFLSNSTVIPTNNIPLQDGNYVDNITQPKRHDAFLSKLNNYFEN